MLKAVAFGASAFLLQSPKGSFLWPAALILVAVLNLVLLRTKQKPEQYVQHGRVLAVRLRLVEYVIVAAGCAMASGERPWLLGIPLVLSDVLVERTWTRASYAAAFVALATWVGLGFHRNLGSLLPAAVLYSAVGAAVVLSKFNEREEKLRTRDRRMNTLMQAASAVSEHDVSATALRALQATVKDLGAEAGFVALVAEDDPKTLLVEAAYGRREAFEFPKTLPVGGGVSGYVVKMGQPISVYASKGERVSCDGLELEVRAAVSVPLVSSGSNQPGRAVEDQTIGALTLAYTDSAEAIERDDIDLLQSISSLLATAILNQRMEERQRSTFLSTLESLATALEARDDYTRGHSSRVCEVSLLIGQSLGFGPEALEELRIGTTLHDIGKIGVPDAILNKSGRLTEEEFEVMKTHPVIGYEICRPLMLSEGVLMIIRNHHEKLDGSGYPDGLKGGELPLSLRIVCVADAFDAMSSKRPYRGVMDTGYVLGEPSKGAGTQFDPIVVEALKPLMSSGSLDIHYDVFRQPRLEVA